MHHNVSASCACTTLRKASRAVGKVYDEALAPCGMTAGQFAILRHVSGGDGVPLSRLAEALVLDRTSLYRALTPIEARGWVAVRQGPGKSKLASLTDAGRTALEHAEPHWAAVQARVIGTMGDFWAALDISLKSMTRLAREEG